VVPRLIRHERPAPAIVAVLRHRLIVPFVLALVTPNQGCGDDIMPVTINIRPNFDGLADDSLNRKTAAVNQRINSLDMESAAGTLDSLSCFVHGDAIDMEATSRFDRGKGDAPDLYRDLYRKPLAGHWFPGNAGDATELNTAILFPYLENFATVRTVACKLCAEWTLSPKPKT